MNGAVKNMALGSFLFERFAEGTFERTVREFARDGLDTPSGIKLANDQFPGFADPVRVVERQRTLHGVWATEWCSSGFPRVHLGHKHAASLMATNTRHESIPGARSPWRGLLVDVPAGLLSESSIVEHVGILAGTDIIALLPLRIDGDPLMIFEYGSVAEFGDFSDKRNPEVMLLARLALGVCMEMTSTTYKGGSLRPQPVKRDPRTGEPRTWTFQLTRDVKVDCRDAVRAYSQGRTHASPSVQCLVRGHWKQQTCGKGGSERKNIFVEPYWRGPEDAHIALRKHVVSDPPDV